MTHHAKYALITWHEAGQKTGRAVLQRVNGVLRCLRLQIKHLDDDVIRIV